MGTLQHALCKNRHVEGCGKTAGVAGDSAHDVGVFIVDLSTDDAMAEVLVVFGGRDQWLAILGREKGHAREAERGKDFAPAELVQWLAGKPLQSLAEQDEADITIFGAGSGIGCKRDLVGLLNQLFLIMGCLEEFD